MTAQEIAQSFESFAIDHKPEGWPAVQQKELSEAAAMLRKQAEAIKQLREVLELMLSSERVSCAEHGIFKLALAATEELANG